MAIDILEWLKNNGRLIAGLTDRQPASASPSPAASLNQKPASNRQARRQASASPAVRATRQSSTGRTQSGPQAEIPAELMTGAASSQESEEDFRLAILNTLLSTPHRAIAPYASLFAQVHAADPLFFGHLAAWYFARGTVNDLKQLFVSNMATSTFSAEYRAAGQAMLSTMAPYQVERVIRSVKGGVIEGKFFPGIAPAVPRSLRAAVCAYLRQREQDRDAFDSAALHARKALKSLYASLRIKPSPYAQQVLFENKPPEASRLHALKLLAQSRDPAGQARLIVEHNIPYRLAVSSLRDVTPSVLVALVSVMTPQELINSLSSLEKRGAMSHPQLRALIASKLEQGKSDGRVNALKGRRAIEAASLDEEMQHLVAAVGDARIKAEARIAKPTALLVDKSGSMTEAIQVGKQIAAIIAPVCDSNLFVYAFDSLAHRIVAEGNELSDWERAFAGITAGGGTACGVAVEMMRRARQRVEQIVIVTDQEENAQPYMAAAIAAYASESFAAARPNVLIVNIGKYSDQLEKSLKKAGIEVDSYTFAGDYYSLPGLLPMLAGGSRLDLLIEIMNYPLWSQKAQKP